MRTLLARLAAVALVATAAFAVPALPAQAAACGDASGVTVVVDYAALGGGVGQGCAGADQAAAAQFPAGGYPLTFVQSDPGFVCRVAGAPASDPCQDVRDDGRYWSLWWADGTSDRWVYANYGVTALRVPSGGSVALVWNDGAGRPAPGVRPQVHSAAPSPAPTTTPTAGATSAAPTKQPTKQPTRKPSPQPSRSPSASPSPGQPTATSSSSPTDSASAEESPSDSPSGAPSEAPTGPSSSDVPLTTAAPTATDAPVISPSAQQTEQDQGGVPTWLVLVLVGLVLLTAIALAVQRRRTSRTP